MLAVIILCLDYARKRLEMKEKHPINLADRISVIKGIGEKTEKDFNKMGMYTVEDIIQHYPRGYDMFEAPVLINSISEGSTVAIEASVVSATQIKQIRNLKII